MNKTYVPIKKENGYNAIICAMHGTQICLNRGSKDITTIENQIRCDHCWNIKLRWRVKDLV